MKPLKLTFAICLVLFGMNAMAQEITNNITQVKYDGAIWEIAASETSERFDWVKKDDHMNDLLTLQLLTNKKDLETHYMNEEAIGDLAKNPILAIPFLSCGIGYDYYQLIQKSDSFMLFEMYSPGFEGNKKVVVLNKVR